MDIVLLLGAGAEPAQSIARRLVGLGSKVYGLANQFPEQGFSHRDFLAVPVNPADPAAVRAEVEKIVAREGAIGAVILAGHNPVEDAFESAHPNDVALAVFAGLAAPLAAVRAAIPGLIRRRGLVLAITRPVFGPGAALGGVVEAGLASFCDGLFGELRDTGVRVCHMRLQENPGAGDPAARYTSAPQSRVQPDTVADAVEAVMRLRENNAITRLVLRPQATREEPRLPVTAEPRLAGLQVVRLPTSKNYPPAEEKIFTPQYRRPDYAPPPEDRAEEDEDEGDDAVDPELAYLIKPRHRDRFVRETEGEPAATPGDEPAGERAEASREERRPEPRPQQQSQKPGKQYHDPYAPPPSRQQQRPSRHGALRIQPPNTGDNARNPGRPQQSQPSGDNRPPRPFDQMPRPQGWQGPRYPQGMNNGARPPQPQPVRPQGGNGPDLHPKYRKEQEERQALGQAAPQESQRPAEQPRPRENRTQEHRPRIFTDAQGRPVGGDAPVSAPATPPAPTLVPVEGGRDVAKDSGAKHASGRSEAVTLSFAKKPPETKAAAPAAKPVVEKIVKAERDEETDEAPVKLKKRPAVKKTPAKADKAAAKVETAADAGEPEAKPKRKPAKKKA